MLSGRHYQPIFKSLAMSAASNVPPVNDQTPSDEATKAARSEIVTSAAPAYPEIPLNYYRAERESMHSIKHRAFLINGIAMMGALELFREIFD